MLPPDEAWQVALARLEGKLDAIIASNAALTTSVTDLDRRVRDVETSMAAVKQKLNEIERKEPPRVNWTAAAAAVAGIAAVALVFAEQLFK